MEWEKISESHISGMRLISRIYREFLKLNNKENNQPDSKMGKGLEYTFLRRRYMVGQYAHEKMFNATNHEETASQNQNEILPHTH